MKKIFVLFFVAVFVFAVNSAFASENNEVPEVEPVMTKLSDAISNGGCPDLSKTPKWVLTAAFGGIYQKILDGESEKPFAESFFRELSAKSDGRVGSGVTLLKVASPKPAGGRQRIADEVYADTSFFVHLMNKKGESQKIVIVTLRFFPKSSGKIFSCSVF